MIDNGRVRSTIKPNEIEIDDYSVYINTDIREVEINCDGDIHIEYEYTQTVYKKDEFIKQTILQNKEDGKMLEDAIIELAELIGG